MDILANSLEMPCEGANILWGWCQRCSHLIILRKCTLCWLKRPLVRYEELFAAIVLPKYLIFSTSVIVVPLWVICSDCLRRLNWITVYLARLKERLGSPNFAKSSFLARKRLSRSIAMLRLKKVGLRQITWDTLFLSCTLQFLLIETRFLRKSVNQ